MRRFQFFAALFFAVAFSAWLGRAERHTDDMFIVIGLLAIGGCVLGMIEPRRPWVWGLTVPAGIIVLEVWNYVYGERHPNTGGAGGLCAIAALTIGIASVSAYLGSFVRRRISPTWT